MTRNSGDDGAASFFLFIGAVISLGCLFWAWSIIARIVTEFGTTFVLSAFFAGVLIGVILPALFRLMQKPAKRRLESSLNSLNARFKHRPFQVQSLFGIIEDIQLKSMGGSKSIVIDWLAVKDISSGQIQVRTLELPSTNLLHLWLLDHSRILKENGIRLLEPLTIEYKAVKLAFDCQREMQWITNSKKRLASLKSDLQKTINKAESNRLLSSSIGKIRDAYKASNDEELRLSEALSKTTRMLHDIADFLSIPEKARAIIGLEIDEEAYTRDFSQLEESFEELVLITEALQQITV